MNANQQTEQPHQAAPMPSPQASRALSPAAVTTIVIGAFVATLAVVGSCAGLVYLATPSVQDAMERARMPGSMIRPNVNDWWTQRVLSEVYTSALDTVVADQAVQEKLGEPIETDVAAADLFVLVDDGQPSAKLTTFEFDVLGPKGRGTVRVTARVADGRGMGQPIEIATIAVTLEDGTVIDIDPPAKRDVQVR